MRNLVFVAAVFSVFSLIPSEVSAQWYMLHLRDANSKKLLFKADSLYFEKQYDKSLEIYDRINDEGSYVYQKSINRSALYALKGDLENSFEILFDLNKKGGLNAGYLIDNPDFESLKTSPRWFELIEQSLKMQKQPLIGKVKYPDLAVFISYLADKDQLVQWKKQLKNRHKNSYPDRTYEQLDEETIAQFKRNTESMKKLFDKYGYLWNNEIGEKATNHLWLMVQHADFDIEFQSAYLKEMEKAMKVGQASKKDYAYLYDRVQKGSGKPQLYGTQVTYQVGPSKADPSKKEITITPWKVEDPDRLDDRRKEVGLIPMKEYLDLMKGLN